jgi:hypothetical protein
MKLNYAAYPRLMAGDLSAATLSPVFEAGDAVFGGADNAAEIAAQEGLWDAITAALTVDSAMLYKPDGDAAEKDGMGVAALQFARADVGTALIFRGTYSAGGYTNIQNWIKDWVLEKYTARMKQQWTHAAGFEWTAAMQARADSGDFVESKAFRAGSYLTFDTSAWAKKAGA